MADTIDLDEVRRARDAAVRLGRMLAQRYANSIANAVVRWAERTDAAAAPVERADAEAGRAICKWGARRLRAEVRRILVDLSPEARADTVAVAETAFTNKLVEMADRRAAAGEVTQ